MGEILASRKPETLCNHSIHQSFSPNSILSFHILLIIEPDHNKLVSEQFFPAMTRSVVNSEIGANKENFQLGLSAIMEDINSMKQMLEQMLKRGEEKLAKKGSLEKSDVSETSNSRERRCLTEEMLMVGYYVRKNTFHIIDYSRMNNWSWRLIHL